MIYKLLKVIDILFTLAFVVLIPMFLVMILLFFLNYFSGISSTLGFGFQVSIWLSAWIWIRKDFMEIAEDILKKSK